MQCVGMQIEVREAGTVPQDLCGERCEGEASKFEVGAVCGQQRHDRTLALPWAPSPPLHIRAIELHWGHTTDEKWNRQHVLKTRNQPLDCLAGVLLAASAA